jgi:hypothetical protein
MDMNLSDQISQLREIEDAKCFQDPKILSRMAKLLSEQDTCDGWLYRKGCNSPGRKRLHGVAILQELLHDALQEFKNCPAMPRGKIESKSVD